MPKKSDPTFRERMATVEAEVAANTRGLERLETKMTDYHKILFAAIDSLREAAFTNRGAVKSSVKIGGGLLALGTFVIALLKYEAFIKFWRGFWNGG